MNEVTLSKMKQMKLYGMHGAFKTAIETGKTDHYTIDQFTSMMIDAEFDDRNNRKIERAIKYARFHYKASIENVIYETAGKATLQQRLAIRPALKVTGYCT